MRTSRRDLIRLGAVAAVSCLGPGQATAASRRTDTLVDATGTGTRQEAGRRAILGENILLTRSVLNGQIDTAFRVGGSSDSRSASLRLRAVGDLESAELSGTVGSDLCFSALFTSPAVVALPQQTYTLRHEALGTFPIFLVPVGRAGKERCYEATFNRIDA